MVDMKWIKLATDIFDDEKILLLESMPDADSIIVVWIKLLTLAGKQNNSGVFLMNNGIPYSNKMLATIFRRKESVVDMALQFFEQFGMIERVNDVITIPNWEKHQSADELEKIKEQTRNRVARYREKQKRLALQQSNPECSVTCSVTDSVTSNVEDNASIALCNAGEQNKKEKKKTDKKIDIFVEFADGDSELLEALKEFTQFRKSIKAPLTDTAKTRLTNKLQKLFGGNHKDMIESLNQSVDCGWKSIYPLKGNQQSSGQRQQGSQTSVFNPGEAEQRASYATTLKSYLNEFK